MATALPEHLDTVRKSVITPLVTLMKMYEGPQRAMRERDKRLRDYARFKAVKDRDDKADKKTVQQKEQFVTLNEALKDELPRLYGLTAKLAEACLKNFVQIQTTCYITSEAQVLSLGICNGALLADAIKLFNLDTPSTRTNMESPPPPSTVNSPNPSPSPMDEGSLKVSHGFSFGSPNVQCPQIDSKSSTSRNPADPTFSGRAVLDTLSIPRSPLLLQLANTSASSSPAPKMANAELFPDLPRLRLDESFLADVINAPPNETDRAPL
ncbi:unnamed protein product [Penicillium nalgiovense]|nr:unnamed protein product [Penicillium nalgiovense]